MTLTCGEVNGAHYKQQYIRLNIRTNTKIPTLNACKIISDNAANSGSNRGPIIGGVTSTVGNSGSKLWRYCGGNGGANSVVATIVRAISGSNGGGNGGAAIVRAIIQSNLLPISGGN